MGVVVILLRFMKIWDFYSVLIYNTRIQCLGKVMLFIKEKRKKEENWKLYFKWVQFYLMWVNHISSGFNHIASGSIIFRVDRSYVKWVGHISSGSIIFQVGRSNFKWVYLCKFNLKWYLKWVSIKKVKKKQIHYLYLSVALEFFFEWV